MEWTIVWSYMIEYLPRLWLVWIFPLLYVLFRIGWKFYRTYRLHHSGIKEIDHMRGSEFEAYLCWLFEQLGHKVINVGDTGDFGADLLTKYEGEEYVVQAKRYEANVGIEAVQQTVGARGYYETDKAICVTNSEYTRAAKRLAEANAVELWDRDRLIAEVNRVK